MDIAMNQEQYAPIWEAESIDLESNGIYKKLVDLLPEGKVLEIGCGIGIGTHYLAQKHEVLTLDYNQYLIDKAKTYLSGKGNSYQIHKCDLFQLTNKDKDLIQKFNPNIIVCWFIGTDGKSVNKYIDRGNNISEKVKLYRETIEDIIVSEHILTDSVKVINFAIRGALPLNTSNEEIYNGTKIDYDTYVFKDVGFGVNNVTTFKWNTEKSNFRYSMSENPNISKNAELIPVVLSISAEKKNI